jgi:hypothetical protein
LKRRRSVMHASSACSMESSTMATVRRLEPNRIEIYYVKRRPRLDEFPDGAVATRFAFLRGVGRLSGGAGDVWSYAKMRLSRRFQMQNSIYWYSYDEDCWTVRSCQSPWIDRCHPRKQKLLFKNTKNIAGFSLGSVLSMAM